jgi:hypothetical protein
MSFVEWLYPDAKDEAGFLVLIIIDGGTGRLDLNSLAELRACVVYLFPGCKIPLMSLKIQIKTMDYLSTFCANMFKF